VEAANAKGIKIIMDMVFNHCGTGHWWMNDLPSNDWINQWEGFTRSNYRLSTVSDPHVATVRFGLGNPWLVRHIDARLKPAKPAHGQLHDSKQHLVD
jgi:glycosidase